MYKAKVYIFPFILLTQLTCFKCASMTIIWCLRAHEWRRHLSISTNIQLIEEKNNHQFNDYNTSIRWFCMHIHNFQLNMPSRNHITMGFFRVFFWNVAKAKTEQWGRYEINQMTETDLIREQVSVSFQNWLAFYFHRVWWESYHENGKHRQSDENRIMRTVNIDSLMRIVSWER
jgi:hypothetical protein